MAPPASASRGIPFAAAASSTARDNFTAVAGWAGDATSANSRALPTPPNSFSPALPAHGLKAQLQMAKLNAVDSDLDLHEAVTTENRPPSPAPLGATGAITSTLLAHHHLPDILLNHGPLAIRHIMGYLTTSVPGFSGIAPTKARRLVVAALEGRGGGGGGGCGGGEAAAAQRNVEFRKVGWGRWDARERSSSSPSSSSSTPPSSSSSRNHGGKPATRTAMKTSPLLHPSRGIPISQSGVRAQERLLDKGAKLTDEESIHFSPVDDDAQMFETEADKMSMDDSASASCSEAPDDDVAMGNDDPDDMTDDEDWAAVGAAALRAASYPNRSVCRPGTTGPPAAAAKFLTPLGAMQPMVARMSSGMARYPGPPENSDLPALHGASDEQEREAVEALLKLGSL